MPFDQFFSSSNKRHYVENIEATQCFKQLTALPYDERVKLITEWKSRGLTKAQYIALRKLHFCQQGKRWARVHEHDDERIAQAMQEFKDGKRVWVKPGFNTASGAVGRIQKRSSK